MKIKSTSAYIYIIIAMSVWACSFLFTKEALKSFTPVTAVTIRMTMATLFLGLYGFATGALTRVDKKDLPLFLMAGFAQPFCYFVCEAYSLTLVSETVASVILSTIPLFSPIFAWFIVKERVSVANVLGIVISLVGVLLIVFDKEKFVVSPLGLVLLFGAVIAAIVYSSLLKKVPGKYSNTTIVFYVHLSSLVFFYPTFMINDLKHWGEREVLVSSVVCLVILALFASMMGYILFCKTVRIIGVTRANAFCNVMPAITAVAVWIVYGEMLPAAKWVGIVVVIIGLFISQMQMKYPLKKK